MKLHLARSPLFSIVLVSALLSLSAHGGGACHDGSCGAPSPKIAEYKGEESWKNGVVLPKLLTEKMYTPEQICADAKKANAEKGLKKKFALVLHTNHFCDGGHRHCMGETRTMSDPCNKFLQNNFELYHVRTWIAAKPIDKGHEIDDMYSATVDGNKVGPAYTVIDLDSCKIVDAPFLPSGKADFKNGYASWLNDSPQTRFKTLKDDLLKLEGVRQKIVPAERAREGASLDCSEEERKKYPVLGLELVQIGASKRPKIDLLGSLIDEQYEAVHGVGSLEKQRNKKDD